MQKIKKILIERGLSEEEANEKIQLAREDLHNRMINEDKNDDCDFVFGVCWDHFELGEEYCEELF